LAYSIKQLADLAGVSTRTMRYYDQIGLLKPAHVGTNGYRYDDQANLLRLQQILLFRELDFALDDIQLILNRPGFSLLDALQKHHSSLHCRLKRLERLIGMIDQTIMTIRGEKDMQPQQYFAGFDESKYEQEARQRWGETPAYAESKKRWASYTQAEKEAIQAEGGRLTLRMVGTSAAARPDDADVQTAIGDYHAYINKYFYTCDVNFLRNLADMWVEDARFAVNYERIREGGAAFLKEAVNLFCDRNQG